MIKYLSNQLSAKNDNCRVFWELTQPWPHNNHTEHRLDDIVSLIPTLIRLPLTLKLKTKILLLTCKVLHRTGLFLPLFQSLLQSLLPVHSGLLSIPCKLQAPSCPGLLLYSFPPLEYSSLSSLSSGNHLSDLSTVTSSLKPSLMATQIKRDQWPVLQNLCLLEGIYNKQGKRKISIQLFKKLLTAPNSTQTFLSTVTQRNLLWIAWLCIKCIF